MSIWSQLCQFKEHIGVVRPNPRYSVRQFAITFLGLIGSNPQFEGAFRRLQQQDMNSKIIITLFSLFSELERDLISLRTKEALSAKRARGQVLGKPKGT